MAGGHRQPVSSARDAVAAVWRIESPRIVSSLARSTGDFALAVRLASEILASRGHIIPSTAENVVLEAQLTEEEKKDLVTFMLAL